MKEELPLIGKEMTKEPFWALSVEETFGVLKSDLVGIVPEEVERRMRFFGPNTIKEKRRYTGFRIFLRHLQSPLILVLVFAGFLTAFLRHWIDAFVIAAAVLVNTFLGFYQESKAEATLQLLKSYVRTRVRVRRAGREQEIDAEFLVPGDMIHITQGDRIPADARIVYAVNFSVDESILTGEALSVSKNIETLPPHTALPERTSMVFGGTLVSEGFADAIVTATGSDTEFGKIALLVSGDESSEETPLQRAMRRLVLHAGIILGILVTIMFVGGWWIGYPILEMFFIAIAVAVSAVPEGLPVALTVILAAGVNRLAHRKGVVRKLLAAETLGSTSLILTDKTGTLTQARMQLSHIWLPWGDGIESEKKLLQDALCNTDVLLENPDDAHEQWVLVGKPLEVALVQGAASRGVLLPSERAHQNITDRLAFNSSNKFSVSISHHGSRTHMILVGAPDILLRFSSVSAEDRTRIGEQINQRAFSGERLLGVATKELSLSSEKINSAQFTHMKFEGIVALRDPLRPLVADAIARIADAGVRTIMVTGDHKGTAFFVAKEIGIARDESEVMTGDDLLYLSKEQFSSRLRHIRVFARVTPEQKLLLTKFYQEQGEIVAVTGDGINDAPALQASDIGVAIGSGTDVTKSAADLVILDDNFETIVAAIEEGRTILNNIRKVVVYLLSNSLDELLLIGGSLAMGFALPLNALQILFVNFFSDSFPAVAFAFERGVDGLGKAPRKLQYSLMDRELKFFIFVVGTGTSLMLFVLYAVLLQWGLPIDLVKTFIFGSFATYTLLLVFSLRSLEKSILSYNPFSNRYLVVGISIGLFLTFLVIYTPWLQKILGTVALPPVWLGGILLVGVFNICAVELSKWLLRKGVL